MRIYRELTVWQEAMELAISIYDLTSELPAEERYGLFSQMRRAAVSIPSNIAEGRGRGSDREFVRFLFIARGSLMELETQLTLVYRLRYVDSTDQLIQATNRLYARLQRLIDYLNNK